METNPRKIEIKFNSLPEATKKAFDYLSKEEWIKEWYLAGGTALSLFAGHRISVDLDFFTPLARFNNNELVKNILFNKNAEIDMNKDDTVYARIFETKISFLSYPLFLPSNSFIQYNKINILDPLDIAVTKIITISQRGKKKDFFDLYWCVKNIDSLENILNKLPKQYPSVAHDYHHIIKALAYFDDAEKDPEPTIYFNANWKEVKDFFKKEAVYLANKCLF